MRHGLYVTIVCYVLLAIVVDRGTRFVPLFVVIEHDRLKALVDMDRLSKRKFRIVCHEKVVRIPLEGDEILRVHGERTQGVVKTLMNTKFRVDLVPGATPVAKFPYRLAPSEMQELSQQLQELQDEVLELLKKEQLYAKFTMSESSVKDKILATPSETSKVENMPAEMLRDLDQQMEKRADDGCTLWIKLYSKYGYEIRYHLGKEAYASRYLVKAAMSKTFGLLMGMCEIQDEYEEDTVAQRFILMRDNSKEWNSGDDQLRLRWMIYLVVLADAAESVPVLWAEIGESSLTGLELVQETTDKVVLVKEKPKAARDRQKSYVDYRRKPLEFEVGDRALLKVTPWKGVVHFRKKAYRLRLPEELNSVHDTFHVSNLKKCLADVNLHVPLDDYQCRQVPLHFVEEPVDIMD
ncbi:hypothetical protein Tco_1547765 [Tanacetum coccineum]